jgi:hypothetical protein
MYSRTRTDDIVYTVYSIQVYTVFTEGQR